MQFPSANRLPPPPGSFNTLPVGAPSAFGSSLPPPPPVSNDGSRPASMMLPPPPAAMFATSTVPVGLQSSSASGIPPARSPAKSLSVQEIEAQEAAKVVDPSRPRLKKPTSVGYVPTVDVSSVAISSLAPVAAVSTPSSTSVRPSNPDELPENWIAVLDDASGSTYYYNQVTGESTWERPMAAPAPTVAVPLLPAALSKSASASSVAAGNTSGNFVARNRDVNTAAANKFRAAVNTVVAASSITSSASSSQPQDEVCSNFQPNAFKKNVCRNCRRQENEH
jgi:WW domain